MKIWNNMSWKFVIFVDCFKIRIISMFQCNNSGQEKKTNIRIDVWSVYILT